MFDDLPELSTREYLKRKFQKRHYHKDDYDLDKTTFIVDEFYSFLGDQYKDVYQFIDIFIEKYSKFKIQDTKAAMQKLYATITGENSYILEEIYSVFCNNAQHASKTERLNVDFLSEFIECEIDDAQNEPDIDEILFDHDHLYGID